MSLEKINSQNKFHSGNIYLHVSKYRKHLLAADMHGTFIAPIVENNNDTETVEKKDA